MGKPIAGQRTEYRFKQNKILVDGAVINGVEYLNSLHIHRQRSDSLYDLIDEFGNIYEFIKITWKDVNTTLNLDYDTSSSILVSTINNNSFFVKVQDIREKIFGFITLIHSNKIKVHTGDYVYVLTYEDNEGLHIVRIVPDVSDSNVGEILFLSVEFDPPTIQDMSGTWYVGDDITKHVYDFNTEPYSYVECLKEGTSSIKFIPNANLNISADAIVNVHPKITLLYAADSAIRSTNVNTRNPYTTLYTHSKDDIINIRIICEPYGTTLYKPLNVTYSNAFFEYLGTDDNINYKFKIIGTGSGTTFQAIKFSSNTKTTTAYISINELIGKSSTRSPTVQGQRYIRTGTQANFYTAEDIESGLNLIWASSNPQVASVDSNGVVTSLSEGISTINVSIEGNSNSGIGMDIYCSPYIPDKVIIKGVDKFIYDVGDVRQFTVEYIPSDVPIRGIFSGTGDNYTLTNDGLFTVTGNKDNNSSITIKYNTIPFMSNSGGSMDNNHISFSSLIRGNISVETPIIEMTGYNNPDALYIPVGGTVVSQVVYQPVYANITNRDYIISVEDESIISYEQDIPANFSPVTTNIITAKKIGKTNVTISPIENPNLTVTFTVTVF